MENLNLDSYLDKHSGDQLTAAIWNGVFGDIVTKVNEVITELDNKKDDAEPTSTAVANDTNLFINGKLYTASDLVDGTITLVPDTTYKVEGTLHGQLVIDAENNEVTDRTFLRLNGVTIISDVESPILYKTPADNTGREGLTITLGRDSINTVISTKVAERADDQPGAIYSHKDLSILGTGYLNVIAKGGHGIRGSEVRLSGPHIYVEAVHDAIHGGKKLIVDDGYYFINKGNDAFGTGSEGNIYVFGGHFKAYNLGQYVFNSKGATGYYIDTSDVESEFGNNQMQQYTWAEGTVEESDDETTYTAVTATEGIYNITKHYVKVTGKITGRIVSPSAEATQDDGAGGTEAWKKLDIELNNAYIESSINGSTIDYQPTDSRLKIKAAKDTINVIKNLDAELGTDYDTDAIKSENNITIEPKSGSYLYITSTTGDGVDGGTVQIQDGDGVVVISNCGGRGIKGNAIIPGPTAEVTKSVIKSYITDTTNAEYVTFDGALIVKNNHEYLAIGDDTSTTGFADIFARNGKATKGEFGTTDSELRGVVITGSIAAYSKLDLAKADNIYATEIIDGVNRVPVISEAYFVTPYNKLPIA
jgi:hypothetical protein